MSRNLVQEHISNHLGDNFNNDKSYSNSIIEYLEHILESDELMLHHIYINDYLDGDDQAIILDELVDYFHAFYSLRIESESNFNKTTIIKDISNKIKDSKLPLNPTAKKREEFLKNKWYLRIKRSALEESYFESSSIIPKVIFNLNVNALSDYSSRAAKDLRELFKSKGWSRRKIPQEEIEEKKNFLRSFKYTLLDDVKIINENNVSYITLNKQSFKKNDRIKSSVNSTSFLDNIESVVFLNNYTKKDINDFQLNSLETLNNDFDTKFKHVFSISFNSKKVKNTIWNLIQKKDNIKNSLTGGLITKFQNHIVLNNGYLKSSSCRTNFFGYNSNQFWDSFSEIADSYGLYELTSIKFKNVISLCFSDFIRNYILNTVFNNLRNNLINLETQNSINELEDDIKEALKNELKHLLDFIKESDYLENIKTLIKGGDSNSGIIISASIANNDELREEILKLLNVTQRLLKTWYSKNFGNKNLLVLAYRDIGNYKYHFYPNLIEYENINIEETLVIKFLFHETYEWALYSYNISLAKLLSNPLLIEKYNWNDLLIQIKETKPKTKQLVFERETYYSNLENATEYRIKYFGANRSSKIDSHDQIIICDEKGYEILSTPTFFHDYSDQHEIVIIELSDLVRQLDLQEVDYNRPEITEQLALLKIDYEIEDLDTIENGGRLWKILLSRQREKINDDNSFYNEVQQFLKIKNISIVSTNTFFNVWCNPESDTIRTNLKALQEICEFLKLDPSYFKLVRRFSSDTTSLTTQSTRIHNELIMTLINSSAITEYGQENYDLLLLQLINNFTDDFKHDLSLIGFSEADFNNSLKEIIHSAISVINREKQKIEKLTIKEPFDE
jgi:hypothetical protein